MTVMKTEEDEAEREQMALKKEQEYIRHQLGVKDHQKDRNNIQDSTAPQEECHTPTPDEKMKDDTENTKSKCTVTSKDRNNDCTKQIFLSNEEKPNKCVSFVVDLNVNQNSIINELIERHNLQNLPLDLQKLLGGLNQGIPSDYSVPIDKKPDWLDMKKFKIGQKFAQKYYFGLNYSEMLSLMVLFSFPGGLEPLIFTGNSATPFTAFRRYLSTALRVKSWFEHDVWNVDNLGYKNIKLVRAMHLNVSNRLNAKSHKELKSQLTLWGSSNEAAVWCPMKEQIRQDFQSCCPFQAFRPTEDHSVGKIYVNQLDMSITQFGFVGLMVMFPGKFGAGSATEEELEGFIHLWRGLGYLLGIEDKYNFCNGTLEEVRQRGRFLIDNWAKPSFQHITEDWEHMSRCMIEGISYYVPGLSFEVSLLYLCWVLDIPAPQVYASLTWWQTFMFTLTKVTMTFTIRLPGMVQFHNWLIRRALARASNFTPEQLKKLESRTYNYEKNGKYNTRL
uniref:Uncharacterized protein n=1 Tax=Homalodisca liturata TaxID=320908 RepID=A0A1B6K519_9HEMI